MTVLLSLLCLFGGAGERAAGELRGVVMDVRGGEPLARVLVRLPGTAYKIFTDEEGRFHLPSVAPGEYVLQVSTVGYRLVRQVFSLRAGQVVEFEIVLSPDTFRQSESIEVRAGPFEAVRQDSPTELTLEGDEVRNLASVLADDPLRAVQGMPGVSSNDDFNSFFAIRGAGYHRVGLYVDDVLVHMPFHMVVEDNPTGSLTLFSGDTAQALSLHSGAFPARYADRTGAAVEIHSREGSRQGVAGRATASMSNAGAMAEGPLGSKGAWLAGVRKSYLQYILRRTAKDETLAFGFLDGQGRLSYELTRRHRFSLSLAEGYSDLDRTRNWQRLGLNSPMLADYHLTLASAAWHYTPGERVLLTNRLAFMRERHLNRNRERLDLSRGHYGEWVWNANANWAWSSHATLEGGGSLRRVRDDGFWNYYELRPDAVRRLDEYGGRGLRAGGYVEQSWGAAGGRVRLSAGMRWDAYDVNNVDSVTPHAAVVLVPHPRTELRLGWGQYVQHPDLKWMLMRIGSRGLLPERAHHVIASIEQRLGERSRLRAEFYNRDDRDLLFRPLAEPRLRSGAVFVPPEAAPLANAVRGYARGFEIFFQRRTANRLSGWVSYAYGRTGLRNLEAGGRYPSDTDQLHTVNVFGSYRIRPTANLSMRFLYGSGFPIPGFFRRVGGNYYLAETRNSVRMDDYHRLDLRLNKAFVYNRWKLTLYAEVVNVYNQTNYRFDELRRFNRRTGEATLRFDQMLPILPSVGLVFEFGR